ncbi:MAG TPA: energy transducer TonB [Pyrinomonadaceae bacterium]|nr:energy transducer TonB [Pyrinomonadaceae bacterium]
MSMIDSFLRFALALVLLAAVAAPVARAQSTAAAQTDSTITPGSLSQAQIDEIIRKFTAKETQFRRALNTYAFKRDALVQILGMGGQVTGEYHRVSDFTFDDQGNRYEKINFFPLSNMSGVITPEDLEDLGGVNPFALEAAKLNQYNFKYVGKDRIDELDLYVFDVAPKVMPDAKKTKERFFIGRIWVDDQDLQIVKSKGKAIPETKNNKFPIVETYREQIDGKFWFPTYAYADDDLIFDNGQNMRIRMQVKYTNYIVGRGRVTITELDEVKPDSTADTSGVSKPRATGPIESGDLNSKATDLPAPIYPGEAKKVHASGQVKIRVIVDETGRVLAADVVSGPKPLWMAAIEAARKARFAPTLVGDTAVKITGILTYDFVEP